MKESKEYKISIALFIAALVVDGISLITGLIPDLNSSIDKICMHLGFALLGFGLVFLAKAKDSKGKKGK
ncbi:MAG: hypothetical protein MJ155_01100 [Candidatus Saccharibacteria bacterium]|nr:hypothetical protein [Candidatus Saccharibacteria bacterium]